MDITDEWLNYNFQKAYLEFDIYSLAIWALLLFITTDHHHRQTQFLFNLWRYKHLTYRIQAQAHSHTAHSNIEIKGEKDHTHTHANHNITPNLWNG